MTIRHVIEIVQGYFDAFLKMFLEKQFPFITGAVGSQGFHFLGSLHFKFR